MRKWFLRVAAVVCCLLLAVGLTLFLLYRASQRVPEFYREALQAEIG